jgi:selenide,water dikinase
VQAAHASLVRTNEVAARVARSFGARACTDVSGFGLAHHLGALLRASGVGAVLEAELLPTLPGALELLASGLRSTFHAQNVASAAELCELALEARPAGALLFDPQTSGGLLFGVAAEHAEAAVVALREAGDLGAAAIGSVVAGSPRIEVTKECRRPEDPV